MPRLRDTGYAPIVIPPEDQDPRLVCIDAPRTELGVTLEVVLGWTRSNHLPNHRVKKDGTAPRVHRGRRFALRSDVVTLRDGMELTPQVRSVPKGRRGVYVIELDTCSQSEHADGTCVYVGETSLTPRERFIQHIAGHKSSRHVRKLGTCLRFDLYGELPLADSVAASQGLERTVGADLEDQGFKVHGAH